MPLASMEAELHGYCVRLADKPDASGQEVVELCSALELQRSIQKLLTPAAEETEEVAAARARSASRDNSFRALRMQLGELAQTLATTLDRSKSLLDASKSLVADQPIPPPEDILTFAHRLRYTTFAHAGLVSQPPAPQQAQMLNSTQFRYSQLHAADALPSVLTAQPTQAKAEAPADKVADTAAAAIRAEAPGLAMPVIPELPPMPANWKPGDPLPSFPEGFQLPSNIPEMPPGWKPGDTLPFTQNPDQTDAAVAAPATVTSEVVPAAVAQPVAAAPQTVKPDLLSFILNPDMEVAEDYSTDESDDY